MPAKKCPKCGAAWYTDLLKCAFCGIEGIEQVLPDSVGQVMDRGKATPKEPEAPPPPPPAPPVDVAAPAAPPSVPPPAAAEAPPPPPPPAEPPPTAPARRPALPPGPPPAPALPSSTVPLVFGLLGLVAAAVVPATVLIEGNRIVSLLLPLAASVLLPFAPFAWWTGLRYEARCRDFGFGPAASGRAGRRLGMAVTLLLAAEGSAILFLAALRRLGS